MIFGELQRAEENCRLGQACLGFNPQPFARYVPIQDLCAFFLRALKLGGPNRELRARVEQNLGILANIHGELEEAVIRYGCSLEAYREIGDEHGCAIAYHNLGMVSADRQLFDEADGYFRLSLEIAQRGRDVYLQGLCLMNHAEVHVARQRFEDARQNAEASLAIFDQLGVRDAKAGALTTKLVKSS